MTRKDPSPCPRCGKPATGKFCIECGATLTASTCGECAGTMVAGARYCHHCGATAGDAPPSGGGTLVRNPITWVVPGVALLAVLAYFIGQQLASKSDPSANSTPLAGGSAAPFAGGAGGAGGAGAVDLSQISPEERASRLFDRVMSYGERGRIDSAKIFAPMAIQAYEMLGSATPHSRYDVGMIAVVSGDAARAKAEADTILKENSQHLLGLALAAKAAGLANDLKARAAFEKRLVAAEPAERAKKVLEYDDHKADLDAALVAAKARK